MLHVIPVINTPNSYQEYNITYVAPLCYFFAANTPNSYHGYNITYTSLLFFCGFSGHAAPGNDMLHLYPVTNTRNGYHGYN